MQRAVAVVAGRIGMAVVAAVGAVALLSPVLGVATVTTYGISMNPVYFAGDLVLVAPRRTYAVGDIAAFPKPGDEQTLVLHRIIGGDAEGGFVFQGDNNDSIDPVTPTADELVGSPVLHVPGGGVWLGRLTSPPALAAYTFLLLTLGATSARTRRRRRKELRTMSPRHRTTPPGPLACMPDRLKPVAAGAVAAGVLGLALSGAAWTGSVDTKAGPSERTGASMAFSYTAHVPQSAAYDGTTVTAPQPVFRKLADALEVSYRYAGPPGELSVTAELSTDSGWTSSLPLSDAVEVDDGFEGSVSLDLAALERRAGAAAEVIGATVGTVALAVVPTVTLEDGSAFSPRFGMSLDATAVRPDGDLVVTEAPTTTGATVPSGQVSVLGREVEATTARVLGAALVLIGLLTAAAVAAATRLAAPVAEAERVRRRHGDLILRVMPVALVAGRPVVDVPDVDSLVKLAERYGLLVLTWSRGGTDTYVVQDESTTYRCRSGAGAGPVVAEHDVLAGDHA